MSSKDESINSHTRTEGDGQSAPQSHIPSLVPVTPDAREIWEDYRNAVEAKAQKFFPMPGTFQMVPIKMAILNIEGTKTYFFKARIPNNRFINVRVRLSGKAEPRDNQVAIESRASVDLDEQITKIF